MNIKDIIIEKFKSVNHFCSMVDKEKLSRQTIYNMANETFINPTVKTIIVLAEALDMEPIQIFNYFAAKCLEKEQ